MRLSTLVTFMLPLSALAAPSLVERQSAALEAARKDVVDGLANAGKAVNTTLAQAATIKSPSQQAVIYDVTKVQADIAFANAAVDRIGASIQAAEPSKESEYVNYSLTTAPPRVRLASVVNSAFVPLANLKSSRASSAPRTS